MIYYDFKLGLSGQQSLERSHIANEKEDGYRLVRRNMLAGLVLQLPLQILRESDGMIVGDASIKQLKQLLVLDPQ